MKTKYLNLSMVLCLVLLSLLTAFPARAQVEVPWPPEPEGFWNEPAIPSIFDQVSFGLYPVPPAEYQCEWDFGDGTKYYECWVDAAKHFNADGDYSVAVLVTNTSTGQTEWYGRTVSVRTHDVAITRFTVPQSASASQTRQITVYVRNTRYTENVQVELYKNDMVWVGTLKQEIPPRSANRTTAFSFSYTFTAEDARIGKVSFRAMAFILENEGDDWPMDNDVTASMRVSKK